MTQANTCFKTAKMDVTAGREGGAGCKIVDWMRLQHNFYFYSATWALARSTTAWCIRAPISMLAKITWRTRKREASWNIRHKTNKGAVFMRQNSNLQHRHDTELRKMAAFVSQLMWAVGVPNEKWARLAMQKHVFSLPVQNCKAAPWENEGTNGEEEEERMVF